jgi:isocitrate dehydrogenase
MKTIVLAETLDGSLKKFFPNDKSPARKIGGIDNRGSTVFTWLCIGQKLLQHKIKNR